MPNQNKILNDWVNYAKNNNSLNLKKVINVVLSFLENSGETLSGNDVCKILLLLFDHNHGNLKWKSLSEYLQLSLIACLEQTAPMMSKDQLMLIYTCIISCQYDTGHREQNERLLQVCLDSIGKLLLQNMDKSHNYLHGKNITTIISLLAVFQNSLATMIDQSPDKVRYLFLCLSQQINCRQRNGYTGISSDNIVKCCKALTRLQVNASYVNDFAPELTQELLKAAQMKKMPPDGALHVIRFFQSIGRSRSKVEQFDHTLASKLIRSTGPLLSLTKDFLGLSLALSKAYEWFMPPEHNYSFSDFAKSIDKDAYFVMGVYAPKSGVFIDINGLEDERSKTRSDLLAKNNVQLMAFNYIPVIPPTESKLSVNAEPFTPKIKPRAHRLTIQPGNDSEAYQPLDKASKLKKLPQL